MTISPLHITVDKGVAAEMYRKYLSHKHYSKPVDAEIARTYREISKGRVVVQAIASIVAAGLGDDKLPQLAIVRADSRQCWLRIFGDGGARMGTRQYHTSRETRMFMDFPSGTFVGARRGDHKAQTPLIPIEHRPQRGLENYHVLFEPVWRPEPPADPLLLRRIGRADLWIVLAAWELGEVELAVLRGRMSVR